MGANRCVLDSGALTALAEKDDGIRRYIERAIQEKAEIVVPTVVIAETTTGTPRDASLNRLLAAFGPTLVVLTESLARDAGSLRYRAHRPVRDTIDAIVVATADAVSGSTILTGDIGDLGALASVRGRSAVLSLEDA